MQRLSPFPSALPRILCNQAAPPDKQCSGSHGPRWCPLQSMNRKQDAAHKALRFLLQFKGCQNNHKHQTIASTCNRNLAVELPHVQTSLLLIKNWWLFILRITEGKVKYPIKRWKLRCRTQILCFDAFSGALPSSQVLLTHESIFWANIRCFHTWDLWYTYVRIINCMCTDRERDREVQRGHKYIRQQYRWRHLGPLPLALTLQKCPGGSVSRPWPLSSTCHPYIFASQTSRPLWTNGAYTSWHPNY